ncbi:MAG: ferredoxin--NADP reductase [Gammaproteobacteria bacterium]|nr:ferredoxin--NADP reductase [Gammaproteobacteria bacterium]
MDFSTETVTDIKHWSDSLFSFRTSRPESLRFQSGEFLMLGLMTEDTAAGVQKPLMRAYSIASPAWHEELEFYSIKVSDGALTSRLQHIKPGDHVLLKPKPVGTLLVDALLPGERLWLFATGTGIAPFASILRDPETYQKFEQIIVTHTCRKRVELDYGKQLMQQLQHDEILLELIGSEHLSKLVYYPKTTREGRASTGRITTLLKNRMVFDDLGLDGLFPHTDRAMVCGSKGFNREITTLLEQYGLEEGSRSDPRQFVLERAFVD